MVEWVNDNQVIREASRLKKSNTFCLNRLCVVSNQTLEFPVCRHFKRVLPYFLFRIDIIKSGQVTDSLYRFGPDLGF